VLSAGAERAPELSVASGATRWTCWREFADWVFVRNTAGERGWVPVTHIERA
jgi:hypothetical protein